MYIKETGDNINVPAGILGLVLIVGWIACGTIGCYKSIHNHRVRAKAKAAEAQKAQPTAIDQLVHMQEEPAQSAVNNVRAEEIKALMQTNSATR